MSYNLKTGLVYIPVQQIPMVYSPAKQPFVYQHARTNMGTEVTGFTAGGWLSQSGSATLPALDDVLKGQPNPRPHLYLQAWDPVKSAIAWQVEITGELDPSVEFLRRAGGVMSTASGLLYFRVVRTVISGCTTRGPVSRFIASTLEPASWRLR